MSRKYRWPILVAWFVSIHAIQAGFVVLSSSWLSIAEIRFVPLLLGLLILSAGRLPFMLSVLEEGFAEVRQLRILQQRFIAYVMENPTMRAFPSDWTVLVAALGHQAKRALLRSWLIVLIAALFLKFASPGPFGDYRLAWLIFAAMEFGMLVANGYRGAVLDVPVRPMAESRNRMRAALPAEWVSD